MSSISAFFNRTLPGSLVTIPCRMAWLECVDGEYGGGKVCDEKTAEELSCAKVAPTTNTISNKHSNTDFSSGRPMSLSFISTFDADSESCGAYTDADREDRSAYYSSHSIRRQSATKREKTADPLFEGENYSGERTLAL